MQPEVLFLGSIGAVAETSDYQRQAYNQAFRENGLDWNWNQEVYRDLLQTSGGMHRLDVLAKATQTELPDDKARAIHARKTELACKNIVDEQVGLRPGVADLVKQAKQAGMKVAWVTSTSPENTNAILEASGGELQASDFDRIFHRDDAQRGKPAADVYQVALDHFGVKPEQAVAIEDSIQSIRSSKGAGIPTYATLGAFHDESVDGIADGSYASCAQLPTQQWFG